MRLIDAYALQNEIYKSKIQNPHKDAKTAMNHEFEHNHFMKMVTLQPTAQEEIVRCKDCKYRSFYCIEATDGTTLYTCYHPCANDVPRPYYWFCADGERR